ncbi:MAG: hypothetical protein LUE65_12685 [Clostridiales bacterium]|nr:hypothetical protein [Clostridiales bacterium]
MNTAELHKRSHGESFLLIAQRLDMASRLLEENDSILSATQKEELEAMIQKM